MKMAQQIKRLFKNLPWFDYQGDVYKQMPTPGYCGVCGKKTNYKSLYAVEYCCSEECSRELWHDIFMRFLTDRKRRG